MTTDKTIPDEIKPARRSWSRRILITALRSPISTILILSFLYFGFQAYVLGSSPITNKFFMLGTLFLWLFWFVAKNVFKLVLLAVIIAYGAYSYHTFSTRKMAQCEASGGSWNEQTETCEERTGFWPGVIKRFQDLANYSQQEENSEARH